MDIGDATTSALYDIWSDMQKRKDLEVDLAVMLDATFFCETTYWLEGDRLEILVVWDEIEAIRAKGRLLEANTSNMMPNVAALLRGRVTLKLGAATYDFFGEPYNKWHSGKVSKMPTAANPEYVVTYDDGTKMTFDEVELRNCLDIRVFPEWDIARDSLANAFKYLEDRLTDAASVERPYRLGAMYAVCSAARTFDPGFVRKLAEENDTASIVARLSDIPWLDAETIGRMTKELPALVVASRDTSLSFSKKSITDYSENVLTFWCNISTTAHTGCPIWKAEARRMFCLTPSSAESERVFP